MDLEAIRGISSLARIAGLLFLGTCLFYPQVCFRRPPRDLWWFAGYVAVYVLNGLSTPALFVDPFLARLQTLVQLLILGWIGSILLQEEKFTRHTLLTFSIATMFAAIGMLLGLPGFAENWQGRLSIAGQNPNGLAGLMALSAQALIGLGIGRNLRNRWIRVILLPMSLLPITAMVYSGSRGGMLAFLTGIVVYALPYSGSKRKMTAILGVAIAVVGVIYTVMSDQTTLSRLESSYYREDTAGRDKLFRASTEMIAEKPIFGWGPMVSNSELGLRVRKKNVDAHNLFFHLLLEEGFVGTIPFLIGLGLCVRTAWTARVGSLGLLPLVWLITMLVLNLSGTWLTSKILWLVLALTLASGAVTVNQPKRKNLMLRTILQHSQKVRELE